MKSFLTYLQEARKLFRFDDLPASGVPVTPRMHTYGFVKTGSGRADSWGTYPKGKDYHEKTGMFAAEYAHSLPYSMPRDTRWIVTGKRSKTEKPTLFVAAADRKKIETHKTVVSEYRKKQQRFDSTGTTEYFTKSAPRPISQKIHTNPLSLISKHMNVVFVDDLDAQKKHLEQNNINHGAEGDFSTK